MTMKTVNKYLDIIKTGIIAEKQLISMKSLINRDVEAREQIFDQLSDAELSLTEEQNKKGYDFLMDQWKSPTGKERKNNPFGYREQDVLENFSHFTLNGFYDVSRYGSPAFYLPIYLAHGTNGGCFEYYYNGKVNVIG